MKKKTGFTLAEVLITLAIIGIIAALVLPALLNNFQFRALGTRLSKFMTTVENTSRAFVETEGALDPGFAAGGYNMDGYINRVFSMTDILLANGGVQDANGRLIYNMPAANQSANLNAFENRITNMLVANNTNTDPNNPAFNAMSIAPILLKDGTRMDLFALQILGDTFPQGSPVPDAGQIGRPVLGIVFDPAANALPAAVRRIFGFVVTELGYVYPAQNDGCTWSLYNNRWQTRPEDFANGTPCANAAQLGDLPQGWVRR